MYIIIKTLTTMVCYIFLIMCFTLGANASPLYTKCIGCHGKVGEKKALNKSLIIKNMSKEDFVKSLKGYKDGSYGRTMKVLMKSQVIHLNDLQIEEIANFIIKE